MIKYGMIGMLMMTVPAVQVSAQADAPSFAIFEHRPSATAAEPAEPSFAAQSEMDWGASAATDRRARSRHLADAALIGEQIRYHQVSKGAAAARSWRAASAAVVATPELSA